ncbi:hypothetical protein [Pseudoduganella sp. UC29_71]|uniref:hypothetical protein n=1 Tax=Pseudoduganella sp. UC29_71 TaxID=3350174 RepID=UPI00366D4717
MQDLISELNRLYLLPGNAQQDELIQRLQGQSGAPITLAAGGMTRAIVIAFPKLPGSVEAQHWSLLCGVANALQTELKLPAPAVSISGDSGYGLWLSLANPVPVAQAQAFLGLLHAAYFPEADLAAEAAGTPVELPPCLHPDSGKWAAFINPGLGASFADESGLDMAPPHAGQAALLDGLDSITDEQLRYALARLQQLPASQQAAARAAATAPAQAEPSAQATVHAAPASAAAPDGLLLKDATLEDIVNFLHSKNIEPTFRHLIRK